MKNQEKKSNSSKQLPILLVFLVIGLIATGIVWLFLKLKAPTTIDSKKLENCISMQLATLNDPNLNKLNEENKCYIKALMNSNMRAVRADVKEYVPILPLYIANSIMDEYSDVFVGAQCVQSDNVSREIQDKYINIALNCSKEIYGEKETIEIINQAEERIKLLESLYSKKDKQGK